ncbi:MAG: AmmeMemoRadiSam system protein B [Candidatus Micrarchaeota archaeon]
MRYPAVSGSFYPSSPTSLKRNVDALLASARKQTKPIPGAKAIVCPHAGYAYSGLTAACSFAAIEPSLKKPSTTVVLIGPNHTGLGELISVSFDTWSTPIGKSETDLPLAGAIVKSSPLISKNELAHFKEHSIEVQLPFLQTLAPKAKIVAICMMAQDINSSRMLGQAIYDATSRKEFSGRNFLVLASSDFTHYESAQSAQEKDMPAIRSILALDDQNFQSQVEARGLSICGHGPIAAVLHYARLAGAKGARLLRYTNSGNETDGDESSVVAYASIVIV